MNRSPRFPEVRTSEQRIEEAMSSGSWDRYLYCNSMTNLLTSVLCVSAFSKSTVHWPGRKPLTVEPPMTIQRQ